MGRSSEELKALKKLKKQAEALEWPVENVDYHLVRYKKTDRINAGWLFNAYTRRELSKTTIISVFQQYKNGNRKAQQAMPCLWTGWYVYPGPKPDKKWGPVCP